MAAAARADGVELIVVCGVSHATPSRRGCSPRTPIRSGSRRPGTSLHRLGTELDLGPASRTAGWRRNARRFHFVQRYSWEPWHYGYVLNARLDARAAAFGGATARGSARCPSFVPERFAPALARAAQRWNVSARAAGRAAPRRSRASIRSRARRPGAQGIAQFMPGTAAGYGLHDPFDAERAIDAQAQLMRDLLRAFGAVPLALAAYNAGPAPVRACGCVPPIPETRPTSPRSSASCAAPATPAWAPVGWRCGSCAERHGAQRPEAATSGSLARQTEGISP